MLKLLIFWGTFGLVLIGVLLTLWRNRRRRELRPREGEALPPAPLPVVDPAPGSGAGAEAPAPGRPEPAAAFDPDATRIYLRPDQVAAPTEITARPGADKPLHGTPKLVCLGGRLKGRVFPIPSLGLAIGRAEDNDVMIIDGRISAHHAWIGVVKGRVVLRDYQSLNGTFLNAEMDSPVSEAVLIDGDTISFGGHGGDQFRFVLK